jgi:hypothetical protein
MFYNDYTCFPSVFRCLQVFQTYVASVLAVRTYVANVSPGRCKSRYGVAHVATGSTCCSRLQLLGHHACACEAEAGATGRRACTRRGKGSGRGWR